MALIVIETRNGGHTVGTPISSADITQMAVQNAVFVTRLPHLYDVTGRIEFVDWITLSAWYGSIPQQQKQGVSRVAVGDIVRFETFL